MSAIADSDQLPVHGGSMSWLAFDTKRTLARVLDCANSVFLY